MQVKYLLKERVKDARKVLSERKSERCKERE